MKINCIECEKEVECSKYNTHQKYCKDCAKKIIKERIKKYKNKPEVRKYMRNYYKNYYKIRYHNDLEFRERCCKKKSFIAAEKLKTTCKKLGFTPKTTKAMIVDGIFLDKRMKELVNMSNQKAIKKCVICWMQFEGNCASKYCSENCRKIGKAEKIKQWKGRRLLQTPLKQPETDKKLVINLGVLDESTKQHLLDVITPIMEEYKMRTTPKTLEQIIQNLKVGEFFNLTPNYLKISEVSKLFPYIKEGSLNMTLCKTLPIVTPEVQEPVHQDEFHLDMDVDMDRLNDQIHTPVKRAKRGSILYLVVNYLNKLPKYKLVTNVEVASKINQNLSSVSVDLFRLAKRKKLVERMGRGLYRTK